MTGFSFRQEEEAFLFYTEPRTQWTPDSCLPAVKWPENGECWPLTQYLVPSLRILGIYMDSFIVTRLSAVDNAGCHFIQDIFVLILLFKRPGIKIYITTSFLRMCKMWSFARRDGQRLKYWKLWSGLVFVTETRFHKLWLFMLSDKIIKYFVCPVVFLIAGIATRYGLDGSGILSCRSR